LFQTKLGDPVAAASTSVASCLQPCPLAIRAVIDVLSTDPMKSASYTNALGTLEGRQAIAHYHSHSYYTYDPQEDIVIANGCSGALELILSALLDPSDTETPVLLIPEPGFPLYRVIAEACGATVVAYPLCPEEKWQVDIPQLHSVIQRLQKQKSRGTKRLVIRGMVVNNPSNPTGAVYSASHLRRIAHLCSEYHIPIIADEIYGDLVFDPHTFVPMAEIVAEMGRTVPVVTAGGIGKQYLLPGWRIGWLCIQDKYVSS
jgi:tyrosine aminotransferase